MWAWSVQIAHQVCILHTKCAHCTMNTTLLDDYISRYIYMYVCIKLKILLCFWVFRISRFGNYKLECSVQGWDINWTVTTGFGGRVQAWGFGLRVEGWGLRVLHQSELLLRKKNIVIFSSSVYKMCVLNNMHTVLSAYFIGLNARILHHMSLCASTSAGLRIILELLQFGERVIRRIITKHRRACS